MVETPHHTPLPTGWRPALFVLAGLAGFALIAFVALHDRLAGPEREAPRAARAPDPGPPTAAPPRSPSFDVVRVSPTGDMVMAGRAAPGADIFIRQGEREIGRTRADERGEWIFLPSAPLAAGALALTLLERTADGQEIAGDSSVVLVAPDPAGSGALAIARLAQPAAIVPAASAGAPGLPPDGPPATPAGQVAQDGPVAPNGRGVPNGQVAPNGRVVVEPGQSLWRLARRAYGGGTDYTVIYQANRDRIRNPDLIYPGQVLAMPVGRSAAGP